MEDIARLKKQAALKALTFVEDDMLLGLGTGSTTAFFIDALGAALREGRLQGIRGVPTSEATAARARELGIPLVSLSQVEYLDLAVDGADEVDPQWNLIKGLGRALLREKIVEIHARRFLVIVDDSKLVQRLGRGPLPVEIVPFEAEATVRWLNTLDCQADFWYEEDGSRVVTDNGNYLALCRFPEGIADAYALARALADRPGVVEHGLFLDMATGVISAGRDGVRVLERER
ncbi:MAG: ribose-5-phosphate isomerase RpiA [Caldilineae bacterium]|nr:MAG: ribose-5-phosphate isomerase RpiA [Caldilineae bacterium]